MMGKVEKYLLNKIQSDGAIHLTLIDPEKTTVALASSIAKKAEEGGTAGIMVGGSTFTSTSHLDKIVKTIKRTVKIPVILFPNNITGISRYADAIWFMSLLNSTDPYFLVGAQILGAPLVRKFGLEAIPMAYIIVGEGETAGVIGKAVPIPYAKPELAAVHALAAQYLGMRFIYLEGGSGAKTPVPAIMIKTVKQVIEVPLIVGGGIRERKHVESAVSAGANIIVTGNIIENADVKTKVTELVKTIKELKEKCRE